MAKNKVKYLVKYWKVDKDGVYRRFYKICNYGTALFYLQIMSAYNVENVHIKVDSIEAVCNKD